MRVPCIAHWPSQIMPGQRLDELTTTMDLFPTFVSLAGGDLPTDRQIDGRDIWPMLTDSEEMKTKASVFYYYRQDQLQAVRFGKWKLYLTLAAVRVSPTAAATAKTAPRLYDLQSDISESENLAAKNPDLVQEILELAGIARDDLGDKYQTGKGVRPAGLVDRAVPLVKP